MLSTPNEDQATQAQTTEEDVTSSNEVKRLPPVVLRDIKLKE